MASYCTHGLENESSSSDDSDGGGERDDGARGELRAGGGATTARSLATTASYDEVAKLLSTSERERQ